MLLNGASLATKTVVRNFDHYLLRPVGEAAFAWNMQFSDDHPEIKGDLKVVSNGTASLMQKEVQSQRLMGFMQLAGNPAAAPFINMIYLIKQLATTLDLDPDKAVNDPQTAAMMAAIMAQSQGAPSQGQPPGIAGEIGANPSPTPGNPPQGNPQNALQPPTGQPA
jgi:hypothetical protein